MSLRLTESARTALQRITGRLETNEARPQVTGPLALGPTITLVTDPLGDVEAAADLLDLPLGRVKRAASTWMAKQANRGLEGGPGRTRLEATIEGRKCCLEMIRGIDRRLASLVLPSLHTCTCGAVWSVEMAVREPRPHL